jgi:hypothetical protein
MASLLRHSHKKDGSRPLANPVDQPVPAGGKLGYNVSGESDPYGSHIYVLRKHDFPPYESTTLILFMCNTYNVSDLVSLLLGPTLLQSQGTAVAR